MGAYVSETDAKKLLRCLTRLKKHHNFFDGVLMETLVKKKLEIFLFSNEVTNCKAPITSLVD